MMTAWRTSLQGRKTSGSPLDDPDRGEPRDASRETRLFAGRDDQVDVLVQEGRLLCEAAPRPEPRIVERVAVVRDESVVPPLEAVDHSPDALTCQTQVGRSRL